MVAGFLFSLIAFLLFAVVLPKTLKKQRRMEEIVRTGYSADAQITSFRLTGRSVNGNPEALLELRVTTGEGSPFPAKVKTVIPIAHLSCYQAGAKVPVKYVDINGQKECVIEGTQAAGRYIS